MDTAVRGRLRGQLLLLRKLDAVLTLPSAGPLHAHACSSTDAPTAPADSAYEPGQSCLIASVQQ